MKRIIFISMLLVGVLGIAAVFSTYAWFTSQATSNDNIFESGELIIGLPFTGANDGFISANNLYPGSSVSQSVEVKNLGDIVFKYKVISTRNSGDETFYNKLNIQIEKGAQSVYNGPLKDLNTSIGNINSGSSEVVKFTLSLPEDADNTYQGKLTNVKFTFEATQLENNN